jgi:hypothetical protein
MNQRLEELFWELCNLEGDLHLKEDYSDEAVKTYKDKSNHLKKEFNAIMVELYSLENLRTDCPCGSYHEEGE